MLQKFNNSITSKFQELHKMKKLFYDLPFRDKSVSFISLFGRWLVLPWSV